MARVCSIFEPLFSQQKKKTLRRRIELVFSFSISLSRTHPPSPLVNHASAMKPRQSALASRIRRVMLADEDVGKVAAATPALIGAGLEAFIDRLIKAAAGLAVARGDRNVTAAHL